MGTFADRLTYGRHNILIKVHCQGIFPPSVGQKSLWSLQEFVLCPAEGLATKQAFEKSLVWLTGLRKCCLDETPGFEAAALSGRSERSQEVSAGGTAELRDVCRRWVALLLTPRFLREEKLTLCREVTPSCTCCLIRRMPGWWLNSRSGCSWWFLVGSVWFFSPSCRPSPSRLLPDALRAAPALPGGQCLLWHRGTRHPGLSNSHSVSEIGPRSPCTITAR